MKVVLVNGTAGAGKDSFTSLCSQYGACTSVSTVDWVRTVAAFIGWDGRSKTPADRRLLSDLKDAAARWNDVPYQKIKAIIKLAKKAGVVDAIFVMCREPDEIQRFVDEFGAVTIRVERKESEMPASNHADAEVYDYFYDYIIDNNGSLEDFDAAAETFMKILMEE